MAAPTNDPTTPRHGRSRIGLLAAAVGLGIGVGGLVYVALGAFSSDSEPTTAATEAAASTTLPPVEHAEPVEGTVPEGRSPDVPDLPFADNPDPTQCGIPVPWNGQEQAWLTGEYEGELIQSEVLLYSSHLRLNITASAPHGSEVKVVMHQPNPVLDYYLVNLPDQPAAWIPAPFLSFEPVEGA